MSVTSDCQIPVEEVEKDEDDEILRAEPNRQVGKRHWFTLYEKMATVRQIQHNLAVDNQSIRAACKAINLHYKQFITWK